MSHPALQSLLAAPRLIATRLFGDVRGGSAIEYGLILAFMVLAMFATLTQLAGTTRDMWSYISAQVLAAK